MKWVLVGPTYPFRGGISHYTTLLYHELAKEHPVKLISFKRQYPHFLFPGKTDREPGRSLLNTEVYYFLDPLNPVTWWRTAQYIRQWTPQIVVMQWWVPFWAPAWLTLTVLLRLQTETKIVFLCHNVLPHEQGLLDRWIAKLVLGTAHGFVVHSESEKAELFNLLPNAKVEVNPLPTYQVFQLETMASLDARTLLGLNPEEAVMLFFGFVRPYKGLDILLKAMANLSSNLSVTLLIVGEFWLPEADIRTQIRELGLVDRVKIINQYISNEEVAQYFLAADVVVLPYRQATQSAVVQIAFGFERPVITTRVGGLAEVVHDGVTGYVVPPNDSTKLARAIEKFFRLGPQDRKLFHHNIRLEANKFAWSRMVSTLKRVADANRISVDTKSR